MADYTTYFNGDWLPFSQVMISPKDRGFQGGDVVFDVGRTYNGKSFRMKEHIDRLYRSLKYARMDAGLSPEEMLEISEEVIRRNEHDRPEVGDFVVWQFVTRGLGLWTRGAGPPTVCVYVEPIDFGHYAHLVEGGAHGVIARTRSYPVESLDSKIKHYSRMNFGLADLEVADVDPEGWPILTDTHGNIAEGTSFNVFLVTDGVIRTPGDATILQGVSRGMVLDLARQLSVPLVEEELQPYDLYTSDEVFFSSTPFGVLPVTKVDKTGRRWQARACDPANRGRLERGRWHGHRGPGREAGGSGPLAAAPAPAGGALAVCLRSRGSPTIRIPAPGST